MSSAATLRFWASGWHERRILARPRDGDNEPRLAPRSGQWSDSNIRIPLIRAGEMLESRTTSKYMILVEL